jgi:predicted ArsR family transcriptional regulator
MRELTLPGVDDRLFSYGDQENYLEARPVMQETRRHILDILRARGHATVDDIVAELQQRRGAITAVTVRHHLTRLQEDDLITSPELRRRATPGRPQHMYALTEKAKQQFPNNYQRLAECLLDQIQRQLPPEGVNVILEGVATNMASEAAIADVPLSERMDLVVDYLNDHGYEANWEARPDGFLLHTTNCPYHHMNETVNSPLCDMDMRLISALLGVVPRRVARLAEGDSACSYMVPSHN